MDINNVLCWQRSPKWLNIFVVQLDPGLWSDEPEDLPPVQEEDQDVEIIIISCT